MIYGKCVRCGQQGSFGGRDEYKLQLCRDCRKADYLAAAKEERERLFNQMKEATNGAQS